MTARLDSGNLRARASGVLNNNVVLPTHQTPSTATKDRAAHGPTPRTDWLQ